MSQIMHDFPDGRTKWDIVMADPPWSYQDNKSWSADKIYPTMSTESICALPVKNIVADNALLFLWATGPNLDQAFIVGDKWGFKYKQVAFVWDKQRALPGAYTSTSCEFVLVFKKGRIPQPRGDRNIPQFLSVKSGDHSGKPWVIYDYISKMFPAQEKLELFSRCAYREWSAWGNEDGGDYHEPLTIS